MDSKEPLIKSSGSRVSDEMSLYASCRFRVDIRDSRPGSAAPQMGSYRRNPEGRGPSTGSAGADTLWGSRPTSRRSAGDLRCCVACEGGWPFAAQRVVQLIPENLRRGPEGLDQRFLRLSAASGVVFRA